jgi:hypothetical protein
MKIETTLYDDVTDQTITLTEERRNGHQIEFRIGPDAFNPRASFCIDFFDGEVQIVVDELDDTKDTGGAKQIVPLFQI